MADKPSNVDPTTMKFLGKEMYLVVTSPGAFPRDRQAAGRPPGSPSRSGEARHHVRRRAALPARLRRSRSRHVRAAREIVRRGRRHLQGGPAAQGWASHLHDLEMAAERGAHHRDGRFLRSDHEDRLTRLMPIIDIHTHCSPPRPPGDRFGVAEALRGIRVGKDMVTNYRGLPAVGLSRDGRLRTAAGDLCQGRHLRPHHFDAVCRRGHGRRIAVAVAGHLQSRQRWHRRDRRACAG